MRSAGSGADHTSAEVDAWCGGCADDETGWEAHFGDFEVGWVQGRGEDLDQDFVFLRGWWGTGGFVEVEVLFEAVCCAAVKPGLHLVWMSRWHYCGGVGLIWGLILDAPVLCAIAFNQRMTALAGSSGPRKIIK